MAVSKEKGDGAGTGTKVCHFFSISKPFPLLDQVAEECRLRAGNEYSGGSRKGQLPEVGTTEDVLQWLVL